MLTAAELIEACRIFIDAKEFEFTIQIIEKSLENPNYENDEIGKILGIAIQVLSMLDGDVAAKKLIDLMPKCWLGHFYF